MKPKKELVRVVRAPVKEDENGVQTGGEVSLDLTGRKPGRGAYVCRDPECLKKAQKARRFERAFSCKIEDAVYDAMYQELCTDVKGKAGEAQKLTEHCPLWALQDVRESSTGALIPPWKPCAAARAAL